MSVVTVTILCEGKLLDPAYELLSLDIVKEINRIPRAQLVFVDGDAAQQQFKLSDTKLFIPGKDVEIKLRYEGEGADTRVFKGLVVKQGVEADGHASVLTVELKDAAIKLTRGRKNRLFKQLSDANAIKKILADNGLKAKPIPATEPVHVELVQYYCSDWDFILSRAEIQGLLVNVDDGSISVQKISVSGTPLYRFNYGIDEIFNLEMEVDGGEQYASAKGVAWDIKKQTLSAEAKGNASTLAQGNLSGVNLAKALGGNVCLLNSKAPLDAKELKAWADAKIARNRLALLRGRLSIAGKAAIKPLQWMEIVGISQRYNGKSMITGVRHRVTKQGWITDVQFGLTAEPFSAKSDLIAAPANGLLPAVQGLQIGIVSGFEEDPDKELRVRLELPALGPEQVTIWARLATPEAGNARGYFFRPEPGDEVVVGYFDNDPRQPVILGALFSSKNPPHKSFAKLTKENIRKGIVTKKGTIIGFVDDKEAQVFIETPKKNKILLDDDAREIHIKDQHSNEITMGADGIVIKSAKDLTLEAKGKVAIKGSQVDVK